MKSWKYSLSIHPSIALHPPDVVNVWARRSECFSQIHFLLVVSRHADPVSVGDLCNVHFNTMEVSGFLFVVVLLK